MSVRLKEALSARQITKDQDIPLYDEQIVLGKAGDWIIARGKTDVACIPDHLFKQRYEVLEEGILLLSGSDRAALEQTLGFGQTREPAMLVAAVRRLAFLKIGTVEVDFSVAQWQEIARRADKRRQTVVIWMQQTVEKLLQDLWTSA